MFPRIVKALGGGRYRPEPGSRPIAPGEAVVSLLDGRIKAVSELERGDVLAIEAGGVIPGDGTVIEGCALVDESAVTGESAPVLRESGSDRSAVTGGTRVVSARLVVELSSTSSRSGSAEMR